MPELGEYAGVVLSAYGVSVVLLAGVVLLSLMRGRKAKAALARLEQEARDGKG